MKKYGTLKEFLEKNKPELHKVTIQTPNYLYFGGPQRAIEHLLNNEMYDEPELKVNGDWIVFVQD